MDRVKQPTLYSPKIALPFAFLVSDNAKSVFSGRFCTILHSQACQVSKSFSC